MGGPGPFRPRPPTPGSPAGSPPAVFRRPGLCAPGRRHSAPALRPSNVRMMSDNVDLCGAVMPLCDMASRVLVQTRVLGPDCPFRPLDFDKHRPKNGSDWISICTRPQVGCACPVWVVFGHLCGRLQYHAEASAAFCMRVSHTSPRMVIPAAAAGVFPPSPWWGRTKL